MAYVNIGEKIKMPIGRIPPSFNPFFPFDQIYLVVLNVGIELSYYISFSREIYLVSMEENCKQKAADPCKNKACAIQRCLESMSNSECLI